MAGFVKPLTREATRSRGIGRGAEEEYYQRLRDYDPAAAARESAMATFADFQKGIGEQTESLRGSQVGRGRLNIGVGYQDQDRLYERGLQDLGRSVSRQALEAEGMRFGATEAIGRYGMDVTGRSLDLTASERDRRARARASKREMWGQLGGAALGAGGRALAAHYGG